MWDTPDLDSLTIFILGGILGHLGFGLYDNFHFGGDYSECLGFGLYDTSDLDSMTIFIWGGILGHLRFGLYDNFHFGGYISGTPQIWTL